MHQTFLCEDVGVYPKEKTQINPTLAKNASVHNWMVVSLASTEGPFDKTTKLFTTKLPS